MSIATPPGYRPLDEVSVRSFLNGVPEMRARLGGTPDGWSVQEVGDGNLNLVFLVDGPAGSACVKQSLPYVRAAGESWPMPLERAFFEQAYYRAVGPHVEGLAPALFHYEPELFAMVMERLSPHIILRRGLIAGRRYPDAAAAVGDYIARASFWTSDFAISLDEKFALVARFADNLALRRITAELVFADPYRIMDRNRWTSPELDGIAADFRADSALKAAASDLGWRFLTEAQALIHGDLHTGSVMVTETDTRVMDPEFAVYGPIGFDLGAFLANLLMSFFSQPGHATSDDDRRAQADWVLEQIPRFWNAFATRFLALWEAKAAGDAYPQNLFNSASDRDALAAARQRFVGRLFADMVAFAGAKMIRRILGFAHNADFEMIEDPARRAPLEKATLILGRRFILEPEAFSSPEAIVAAARGSAR